MVGRVLQNCSAAYRKVDFLDVDDEVSFVKGGGAIDEFKSGVFGESKKVS